MQGSCAMPKHLALRDWIDRRFDGPGKPGTNTVIAWIKAGKIYPPAIKMGRGYYVQEDAELMTGRDSLLDRVKMDLMQRR
jgi:hypothetical protein